MDLKGMSKVLITGRLGEFGGECFELFRGNDYDVRGVVNVFQAWRVELRSFVKECGDALLKEAVR